MLKKKIDLKKVASVALMILGALTLLYFLYELYVSCDYIGTLMKSGQIEVGKDFGKIIQYIMTQSFAYIVYGIAFVFMGYILLKVQEQNPMIKENTTQE